MFKKTALSLASTLLMGLLTACNPTGVLRLENGESNSPKLEKIGNNTHNGIGKPLAIPPQYNKKPLEPGQVAQEYLPNGLPALKPMKGVNVETLFSKEIKDNGKRFKRVENAVVDLRKEFEVYKPSIVRLAAVESDIQNLIKELEVLLQETPEPSPYPLNTKTEQASLQVQQLDDSQPYPPKTITQEMGATEEPTQLQKKKPPKQTINKKIDKAKKAPPKPKQYEHVVAQNLRIGEHSDRLRFVIDTNRITPYTIDLDNEERLIIIEMPKAKWVGNNKDNLNSKLIESYTVEPINNGGGSMIIITLKGNTKVLTQNTLKPDNTSPYHRIYFDLKM